jgi:TatD DNase family protein
LNEEGLSETMKLTASNGTLLVTCGVDGPTSSLGLDLAAAWPMAIKAFVGVHPSEAGKERSLDWLGPALKRATGLGEVGLDPKYSEVGARSTQQSVFREQLAAAEREGKPVQVHSRGAERECLKVLAEFRLRSVLMHWFEGEDVLKEVIERGYYVSFGPPLAYSKKLQRMAAKCERGLVVTETDSPVPYAPLRGTHGPWLVPSVVFELSQVWRVGFDDARELAWQNSVRYLGPTEKG